MIPNYKFRFKELDNILQTLCSADAGLASHFEKYLAEEYPSKDEERLSYYDVSEISRYIIERVKANETSFFNDFFEKVEEILNDCDDEATNIMVVGLFEGIQNAGGPEINYYFGFDQWLKPVSKKHWDNLIDDWEGTAWREKQ